MAYRIRWIQKGRRVAMSYQLFVFPTPPDAHCELAHDTGGWNLTAVGGVNPDGVAGQVFIIPETTPNGNGAWLTITAKGKSPVKQHGFVFLNDHHLPWPWPATQQAAWSGDIFELITAAVTMPRLVLDGHTLKQDVP